MAAILGNPRMLAFLMVGALVGVLGSFFILRGVMGGGGGSAPAPAVVEVVKKEFHGPVVPIKERVFNLADPNARRYVKLAMSLEFAAEDDKFEQAHGGAESKKLVDAFVAEMGSGIDLIHDTLTSVVSSKTMAELLTPQGKEALKHEIADKLNTALPKKFRVKHVFFTDFVVQ